jgi:hypothetical protein
MTAALNLVDASPNKIKKFGKSKAWGVCSWGWLLKPGWPLPGGKYPPGVPFWARPQGGPKKSTRWSGTISSIYKVRRAKIVESLRNQNGTEEWTRPLNYRITASTPPGDGLRESSFSSISC